MCRGGQRTTARGAAAAGQEPSSSGSLAVTERRPERRLTAWAWSCGMCTFANEPSSDPCEMCGFPRGSHAEEPAPSAAAASVGRGAPAVATAPLQRGPAQRLAAAPAAPAPPSVPAPPRAAPPRAAAAAPAPSVDAGAGRALLAALKHEAPWPTNDAPREQADVARILTPGHALLAMLKGKPQPPDPSRELLAALKGGGGSGGSGAGGWGGGDDFAGSWHASASPMRSASSNTSSSGWSPPSSGRSRAWATSGQPWR